MTKINPRFVVLVTGLPGAGKTTLARKLSVALSLPLLSRDVIKEAIYDAAPGVSRAHVGDASVNVAYQLLADMPAGVIMESWINTERGDDQHLKAALKSQGISRIYEIFCDCPGEIAAERYAERKRSKVHLGGAPVVELIRTISPQVKPLNLGPHLTVDTSRPVDIAEVAQWLKIQTG